MTGYYYGIATEKAFTSMMQPMYRYKMAKRLPKKYKGFDSSKVERQMHDYMLEHAIDMIDYMTKHKVNKIKSVNKRISKLVDYRKYWVDMALYFKTKYNVHDEDLKTMCKYLSLVAWYKSDDYENNNVTKMDVALNLDTKMGKECQLRGQTEFSAMSLSFHYMAGKKDGSAVWGELILTSSTDPATDHMLCMAVDCKAIATKQVLCEMVMEKTGKTERHKIRFCEDHYLRQMAYQYAMEHKK